MTPLTLRDISITPGFIPLCPKGQERGDVWALHYQVGDSKAAVEALRLLANKIEDGTLKAGIGYSVGLYLHCDRKHENRINF